MTTVVTDNSEVEMHFTIKSLEGEVVESTHETGKPVTITMGAGILAPGLEEAMMGLSAGDKKSFDLNPENAFGMPEEANIQAFPRSQFPEEIPLEVGVVLAFSQPDGVEIPGMVTVIEEQQVTVDFNHPLAGKSISFEVEIISIVGNDEK